MTSLLSAELAATCNALGYFDAKTNKYYADSNTLETVKDLIRYLRRDDENHDVRRQLGETKVLQTDLLPLLKSYWEETDLFDVLLRLIVNLSIPALMLWNEEIPTEKIVRNHYLQIEDHLQSYKEAFADEAVWAVLSTKLSRILETDYTERGEENSLIIERILILTRNVLYVPADSMEKRPDNDASVHDQVLWALHQSGMLDIILYMTSSSQEQAYYMHILEILSFMLREQKASELARAELRRNRTEKIRDEAELLAIRHRESNQRQAKSKMHASARHSRFGGTFVVKSLKSISDNELIYHKPLHKLDELTFDADKKKMKTPKNRMPVVSSDSERRSAFTIRLFLKEFCVEFLNGAYNTLMHHVKDNLVRAKAQAHDESYYLWALRFFLEFNRGYKFEVKLVSETMSIQTFHYVQQQSESYFDLMQTDKKKLRSWSRRLHLALLAYRELLLTLCAMDKSPDGTVRDSSKVIKSNIFYVPEYREFILALLVTYDELKLSDAYLKDLIETQHIFLKTFEGFCGAEGSVMVQKKVKGKRRRNKKAAAGGGGGDQTVEQTATDPNLEGRWDEVAPQLSIVLEGGTDFLTDVVPFDAASEVPIDDQKSDAMKNVQRKLRGGEFEGAIALLRAAREVWPENDSFGSDNMTPEEEFLALRDIFFADLGENGPGILNRQRKENDQGNEEDEDDYDEEEEGPRFSESDFKFEDFAKRLASPRIVRACGLALRTFDTNSANTNHCIVKLLHRIAFDCKMYVVVFQLSIFRTFQRIFAAKDLPQHKELVKFATYIVRQFFKVAENNKKIFMEALFWKSSKEAYDVEHGYGSYHEISRAAHRMWSEEEEDEVRRLFMEHQQSNNEEDVVDWIVNNLIDNTKTRRAVLKKLKEMCLLVDYKGRKKSGVRARIPQSWEAEEETQLQELYEEFKVANDPLGCIMARLEVQRPKNRIIEKMLVMGLITDRAELRKKRAKTAKSGGKKSKTAQESDDEGSNSSNCDHSTQNTPRSSAANIKSRKKRTANKNRNAQVQASRPQIIKLLLDSMQSGQEEALEWLKESISDAVEVFEEGTNDGIPLVPVMDYALAAMEDSLFQRTLKALGICEPFDEQEAYWRIPVHYSVDTLREYCELIQTALDKTLTIPENDDSITQNECVNVESDDDDDIFDKLRGMSKAAEKVGNAPNDESSDRDVFDELRESRSRTAVGITSESVAPADDEAQNLNADVDIDQVDKGSGNGVLEEAIDDVNITEETDDFNNTSFSKRKGRIIDSDSEEENREEESGTNSNAETSEAERKRIRSDSDTENPSAKRTRMIIDSDDE